MIKKIKVIIAGGGIGGAAAALALLRKGFDVEVYEQAPELGEVGAGVQLSPNGARALEHLGVFETLKAVSCAPERKEFRLWNTGDSWPMFDLGERAIKKYGYPYLTVYRPDLLATLVTAAQAIKPDVFNLDSSVIEIGQNDSSAYIVLKDGRVISGDILIGADGIKSLVRKELWGQDDPRFAGMIAWRAVIPMETLPKHMQVMVGSTWIGPGGHAVNYPLRDGTLMNFVGTVDRTDWKEEGWQIKGDAAECLNDFSGWHEDVHALIKSAPSLTKWAFGEREPMQKWSKGRISLLGDACHATLPFLAQGAVMAIEDGVMLARCLEHYAEHGAKEALLRYEGARVERTTTMVRNARANTDRFHSAELVDKARAEVYLTQEMGADPLHDRYHWLYIYDVANVSI
jgi:salicylate hydroxylase